MIMILITSICLVSLDTVALNVIAKPQKQEQQITTVPTITTSAPTTPSMPTFAYDKDINSVMLQDENLNSNSIELSEPISNTNQPATQELREYVPCGTLFTNSSKILFKNANYPETIYTKTICETVIERAEPTIKWLVIKFNQLELYRPTLGGQCLHDKFAIYTDLNALLTPVICGNNTGKTITIPFPIHTSVIVSITTSDLDHDRCWSIDIDQEK